MRKLVRRRRSCRRALNHLTRPWFLSLFKRCLRTRTAANRWTSSRSASSVILRTRTRTGKSSRFFWPSGSLRAWSYERVTTRKQRRLSSGRARWSSAQPHEDWALFAPHEIPHVLTFFTPSISILFLFTPSTGWRYSHYFPPRLVTSVNFLHSVFLFFNATLSSQSLAIWRRHNTTASRSLTKVTSSSKSVNSCVCYSRRSSSSSSSSWYVQ